MTHTVDPEPGTSRPGRGRTLAVSVGLLVLAVTLGCVAGFEAAGLESPDDAMLSVAASHPWILLAGAALSPVPVGPVEELLLGGVVRGNRRTAFGPVAAIGLIVVFLTL